MFKEDDDNSESHGDKNDNHKGKSVVIVMMIMITVRNSLEDDVIGNVNLDFVLPNRVGYL